MTPEQTALPAPRKPLRLWPGVIALAVQWLAWFIVPTLFPRTAGIGLLIGVLLGLAIVLWWLFFSRAPWLERVGALLLIAATMIIASRFLHVSIATGMMGY